MLLGSHLLSQVFTSNPSNPDYLSIFMMKFYDGAFFMTKLFYDEALTVLVQALAP
jgi:hypothetical protein